MNITNLVKFTAITAPIHIMYALEQNWIISLISGAVSYSLYLLLTKEKRVFKEKIVAKTEITLDAYEIIEIVREKFSLNGDIVRFDWLTCEKAEDAKIKITYKPKNHD